MSVVSTAVRKLVRERAGERCEYCHKPDNLDTYSPQVDHILPPRHGGNDIVDNFAWACFNCNNHKGTDVASYDPQTNALTPLFNPRAQAWDDHFELVNALIVGKTAVGRVTIKLLQMNHPRQIEIRQTLIEAGLW